MGKFSIAQTIAMVFLVIAFVIFISACGAKTTGNAESQNSKNSIIGIIDDYVEQDDYDFELACFLYDLQFVFAENTEFGITAEEIPLLEICPPYRVLTYKDEKIHAPNAFCYLLKANGIIKGVINVNKHDDEFLFGYNSGGKFESFDSHTAEYGHFVQISDGLNIYALSDGDILVQLTNLPDDGGMFTKNVSLEQLDLKFSELEKYCLDINISVPVNDYIAPYMDRIAELTNLGCDGTESTLEQAGENVDIVDLGCCVKGIKVRETAVLGANSAAHTNSDFVMTLNSDKEVYSTTDIIHIWGTLEYVGDSDTIEIWHACPFMLFSITDGDDFDIGGMTVDILASSVLEKSRVYHFDYQKSGGWSADAPDAKYWEDFFKEKDLLLPKGKYTITLNGGFSLSEKMTDSRSALICELKITVKR